MQTSVRRCSVLISRPNHKPPCASKNTKSARKNEVLSHEQIAYITIKKHKKRFLNLMLSGMRRNIINHMAIKRTMCNPERAR